MRAGVLLSWLGRFFRLVCDVSEASEGAEGWLLRQAGQVFLASWSGLSLRFVSEIQNRG